MVAKTLPIADCPLPIASDPVTNSQYRNAVASGPPYHATISVITKTRRYRVSVLTVRHGIEHQSTISNQESVMEKPDPSHPIGEWIGFLGNPFEMFG